MDKSKALSILGLHDGAGEAEIKAAYRVMAQKYDLNNYEAASPLREEAEAKMNEINEAFDLLMGLLRTGENPYTGAAAGPEEENPRQSGGTARGTVGKYPYIRQLVNSGRVDEALAELNAIPHGTTDAEWNFLMGSVYYYKGWLDQAMAYFREAVRLDPGNREYEAALRNLAGNAGGAMPGNPYQNADPNTAAMNCACNYCTAMCCMDMMCTMCRGC